MGGQCNRPGYRPRRVFGPRNRHYPRGTGRRRFPVVDAEIDPVGRLACHPSGSDINSGVSELHGRRKDFEPIRHASNRRLPVRRGKHYRRANCADLRILGIRSKPAGRMCGIFDRDRGHDRERRVSVQFRCGPQRMDIRNAAGCAAGRCRFVGPVDPRAPSPVRRRGHRIPQFVLAFAGVRIVDDRRSGSVVGPPLSR